MSKGKTAPAAAAGTGLGEFARYTALNVLGMIGLSCYILADTFFIARGMGADGLAALNLAIPAYSFIHGSGLMLGIGGAAKYSIFRGQGNGLQAEGVFPHAIGMAILLSVIFVLLGLCFPGQLAVWLGADAEAYIQVYTMTRTYLRVLLLFAPAFLFNNVILCFVRNDGDPGLAMLAMLTGSMANILLDYLFIFPLHMGIFGAALATGFAPLISLGVLSRHRISGKNQFHLRRTKVSRSLCASIAAMGLPSLVAELASGIVILVFNLIILGIEGNIGVAAYGVIANLSLVVVSIYTGIAQGMQPLASRAYGGGDQQGLRRILRYGLMTVILLAVLLYLLIVLLADPIAAAFNSEKSQQLQQIAAAGLRIYFLASPFVGVNVIMAMFFSATEKPVPGQIISLARGFFVIIPLAFALSALAGMTGVWLTFPVTEALVLIIGMILYKRVAGRAGRRRTGA